MTENILLKLSNAMADAAESAGKATVMVNARRRLPASGIAYSDALILTASHVVEREEDIPILLPDGRETTASLAGRDPGADLALLKLGEPLAQPAVVSREAVRVGQLVLALGRVSPAGLQSSLGAVSAIAGPLRTHHGGSIESYLRTDCIPYPGFSGGPLVSADGSILGLNTSGLTHGGAITIPAVIAWKTAESLAVHGRIRRGYLGIRSQPVDIPTAAQLSLKREQTVGLLVVGVESGSPAGVGGMMVGDILVEVSGAPVSDHETLFGLLGGDAVGKPLPIEVLRGGKPHLLNVTLGER